MATVAAGIFGRLLFKNNIIMPAVVFAAGFGGRLLWYNATFLVWVIVYTLLALLAGYLVDLVIRLRSWTNAGK
ncbi:DUF2651 family protein [Salibacterium halotolerans]|uniref:DUF2651 family protein n=1 Tax=Salibacterium halotolerans TaxID=1884432 RepID=UPI00147E1D87|nr:DUF2651 family protein [Salibacterium halotolerans]